MILPFGKNNSKTAMCKETIVRVALLSGRVATLGVLLVIAFALYSI